MGAKTRALKGILKDEFAEKFGSKIAKTKTAQKVVQSSRRNAGKVTKFGAMSSAVGMAAAVPIGIGAAIATAHPFQGAVNLAMDGLLYDPYLESEYGIKGSDVDNAVLGRDIGFGELLYNPLTTAKNWGTAFSMDNIKNTQTHYSNLDKTQKMSMDAYERNMNNVSTIGRAKDEDWAEIYDLPYTPAVTRGGTYANGSMVMGMYNGRHGR
jgi:hypothetical protein